MTEHGPEWAEVLHLRTAGAVRQACGAMFGLAEHGRLAHWELDLTKLPAVADRVMQATRQTYSDWTRVPYHSRWRHFAAGGVDRIGALEGELSAMSSGDRLATLFELAITSVLLDAGAGDAWSYRDASGQTLTRSEGLAVASLEMFARGLFSVDRRRPLRADAEALSQVDESRLADAFQSGRGHALVGLSGRVHVLRRLGEIVRSRPRYFGAGPTARLGNLALTVRDTARDGTLPAAALLESVLGALSPIWPGRETLGGENLGDVWTHPAVGRVPLHKLSQWLTYSLCEPLEREGIRVAMLDGLTGLAEYRNGGLFVDAGVLVPRDALALGEEHDVSSPLVIEWRALTVSLLDRTAALLRERLALSPAELPLARVLEGGTWRAGRVIAAEKRPGGGPPFRVRSDGTVF